MSRVRLIYARSHTPMGVLIRNWAGATQRHWSHTGVLLPGNIVVESRFIGGVQRTSLSKFLDRYSRFATVEYLVPNLGAGLDWLDRQIGKPYDWRAVAGHAAGRNWNDEAAWHCHELAEGYLAACGLSRWRPGPHLITPNLGYAHTGGIA